MKRNDALTQIQNQQMVLQTTQKALQEQKPVLMQMRVNCQQQYQRLQQAQAARPQATRHGNEMAPKPEATSTAGAAQQHAEYLRHKLLSQGLRLATTTSMTQTPSNTPTPFRPKPK